MQNNVQKATLDVLGWCASFLCFFFFYQINQRSDLCKDLNPCDMLSHSCRVILLMRLYVKDLSYYAEHCKQSIPSNTAESLYLTQTSMNSTGSPAMVTHIFVEFSSCTFNTSHTAIMHSQFFRLCKPLCHSLLEAPSFALLEMWRI